MNPSQRFKCTIVIMRCPSSVRPSLTFHIFDFSSKNAERNSTKLDRNQDPIVLYKFLFLGRSEKQDGRPGLWLAETFPTSPLRLLNGIQWNVIGSKILTSSIKFVFFGPIGKHDCRPGLSLTETFSTSPLRPLNGIQRNLTGSKISMSSTKFVFFRADPKNKIAALASDWVRHFRPLL